MNQWKFAVLCTHIHALLAKTHVAKCEVVWRGERKSWDRSKAFRLFVKHRHKSC